MASKREIDKHVNSLKTIFPEAPATTLPAPDLFRMLRNLEKRGNKLAEDYCNKPLPEGYVERTEAQILAELDRLLGFRAAKVPVFLNMDPRGYALKIEDDYVREHNLAIHKDWGGYGIIAPEV